MNPDNSAHAPKVPIDALVESLAQPIAEIRSRLTDAGALTPGQRVELLDEVKILHSTVENMKRLLRRDRESLNHAPA
jgi:hypothetical protein